MARVWKILGISAVNEGILTRYINPLRPQHPVPSDNISNCLYDKEIAT